MKTKLKFLPVLMMLALTIGFTACEGDQGEIGPKGDTGAQGAPGEPGAPGEQGPKGDAGDSEATSFGNVELTVSGVRLNDDYTDVIAFTKVIDFKDIINNSPVSFVYEMSGENRFYLQRQFRVSAKENARIQESYDINMLGLSVVEVDGEVEVENLSFSATVIDQNAIFLVGDAFDSSEPDNDFEISNYSYDAATGVLKFNFTYSYVEMDHTFEVSGKVDVIVFKGPAA